MNAVPHVVHRMIRQFATSTCCVLGKGSGRGIGYNLSSHTASSFDSDPSEKTVVAVAKAGIRQTDCDLTQGKGHPLPIERGWES